MVEPKLRFKEENGVQFPDWEEKTFNDIADYKKGPFGSALKKKIFVPKSNSTVKVYEQQNAISKDWRLERYFVTDEYFQANLKSFSVSGGDIIVSCAGTIGEVYELPNDAEKGIINQALMRVRIKKSVINSMVFKCVFDKMISSEGIKISNGSALKNIPPFADMKKQPVFLPSLPEQQKIASLFTELDTLIQSTEKELEGYMELKQGMLQKMFPKKGEVVPEIRFQEFTSDWEQQKLGDVGKTYTGLSGKTADDFGHGEANFITYMNVYSNCIADPTMVAPIEIDAKQHEVEVGDVFFTTSSETPDEVGMACVLKEKRGIVYLNSFCFGFRPTKSFDLNFLAYMLRSDYVRNQIKILAQGVSRYNISKTKMMNVCIIFPNYDEQKKIGEYFQNLDCLIASQQQELDGYKELKKGLLQQMFC